MSRCQITFPVFALLAAVFASSGAVAQAADPGRRERPQLTAADAARHQAADYLAQGPTPWRPALIDARQLVPDFTVAADGSGTHRSVQAAVDAVPAAGQADGGKRWVIRVLPGLYRGPVCVQGRAPLAILGVPDQPDAVTLVDSRFNGLPKQPGTDAAQPCHPQRAAATHGTSGSATVVIASADVWLAHLRVANDATETAVPAQGAQAVALMTLADRIQLQDVRLVSRQDTFYVKRPASGGPARVWVSGSQIEGDVDFVFGNATLVIDTSTLVSRAGPVGAGRGGYVLAPSTTVGTALGFLVQHSRFVAEPGVAAGSVSLGRAWDEGVPPGQWQPGVSPNGQAVVRDSAFGPHITGWAASTARRPFRVPADAGSAAQIAAGLVDAGANRLFEWANTTLPADIARETLAPQDGWAGQGGGTRGGADADPADVHLVRNRAELAAALRPHEGAPRPRIVKVQGRIDLSVDDAGRPLGADDYRAAGFDWAAFAAAFDPATWGRGPPAGPQEDARAASARAQADRVVLKLPSRTTVIGVGPGAQIVHGGLMLDGVSDVIVRNIHFSDAYDFFPAWDPKDNEHGEWNSEYDNLTLRRSQRVWVDHCTFDDGARPDAAEPSLLGQRMQRHDGLLDITRASNHITVSWNLFRHHDKTSLVGGSDRHLDDEGRLKVTFHHNLWEQTKERSPRVRFGQVHVVNNLYRIPDVASHGYTLGVGHQADILSQANAWLTSPQAPAPRLFRRLGRGRLRDEGSLLNGQPARLAEAAAEPAAAAGAAPWQPPYALPIDAAADVAARVLAGAGAGRLWTASRSP